MFCTPDRNARINQQDELSDTGRTESLTVGIAPPHEGLQLVEEAARVGKRGLIKRRPPSPQFMPERKLTPKPIGPRLWASTVN